MRSRGDGAVTAARRRACGAGRIAGAGGLLACMLLGAAPGVSLAAGAEARRARAAALSEARLLEAALNGLAGLVASFSQTLESPALPRPQVESGTMYLMRPARMRWEYDTPQGKLAVADGRRSWLYLPEDRQALIAPLPDDGRHTGMSLLLRPRIDLERGFTIEWGPEPEGGGRRPLKLTPRVEQADYLYLLVEADAEHLIASLAVIDPLGGRVTYRFTHTRRVATLDESLFRFTAPEGVDVQTLAP